MKLRFNVPTTLEVIEDFDEENDVITSSVDETFKAGDEIDVDCYGENEETLEVQFGDGSVATIDRSLVTVVKDA